MPSHDEFKRLGHRPHAVPGLPFAPVPPRSDRRLPTIVPPLLLAGVVSQVLSRARSELPEPWAAQLDTPNMPALALAHATRVIRNRAHWPGWLARGSCCLCEGLFEPARRSRYRRQAYCLEPAGRWPESGWHWSTKLPSGFSSSDLAFGDAWMLALASGNSPSYPAIRHLVKVSREAAQVISQGREPPLMDARNEPEGTSSR